MSYHALASQILEPPREAADEVDRVVGGASPELAWAFQRLLARTEIENGCWLFQGYLKNGYPSLSIRNRDVYGHRLALVASTGVDHLDLDACHSCDVRRCWRFDHLSWGTRLENVRDSYAKGRGVPPPRVTGARHHLATLTDQRVAEIRFRTDPQRALAVEFGVSQSTIWRLRRGMVRTS